MFRAAENKSLQLLRKQPYLEFLDFELGVFCFTHYIYLLNGQPVFVLMQCFTFLISLILQLCKSFEVRALATASLQMYSIGSPIHLKMSLLLQLLPIGVTPMATC